MNFVELFFIAVGLSMDAFAVAICKGLCMRRYVLKRALIIALYFGVFQALMPLAGYFVGYLFASRISAFDHWIVFALLGFIGVKMIKGGLSKEEAACATDEQPLTRREMLPLAFATSIDALVVGVTFAFFQVNILPSVLFIGATTLLLSVVGTKIGYLFGRQFKVRAEMFGGIILILIGTKTLFEHLGVI
jgi:putative Mn2+ efflux pump MntP